MYPIQSLLRRLRSLDQPIAVMVGSALSITRGEQTLGVDDVRGMVERIRLAMKQRQCEHDFDEHMRTVKEAERYQAAFAFVQAEMGPKAVDRIIRDAVRHARLPEAPTEFERDGAHEHWHLPRGTVALGRLLVEQRSRFNGPVLTTNFDPLISMAIERAGGRVDRRVLPRDGRLPEPEDSVVGVQVVHLHGYWRGESGTLHLPQQLKAPRPNLRASLRELLRHHVILVAGYGGWRDAFMQALADVLNEARSELEVLWCFYGDESKVRHDHRALLDEFEGHPLFIPYVGIDAHELFERLAGEAAQPLSGNLSQSAETLCHQSGLVESGRFGDVQAEPKGNLAVHQNFGLIPQVEDQPLGPALKPNEAREAFPIGATQEPLVVICPNPRCGKAKWSNGRRIYFWGPRIEGPTVARYCDSCGIEYLRGCLNCHHPLPDNIAQLVSKEVKSEPDSFEAHCAQCGTLLFRTPTCAKCRSYLTLDDMGANTAEVGCSKCQRYAAKYPRSASRHELASTEAIGDEDDDIPF